MHERISAYFRTLQTNICQQLELVDDKGKFKEDEWNNLEKKFGISKFITKGRIIEKGIVSLNFAEGKVNNQIETLLKAKNIKEYKGSGLSVVIHPDNPFVPFIQMNLWYFELDNGNSHFSGKFDLSPHYIDIKQAKLFHEHLRAICDQTHHKFYPAFKKLADNYLFIPHRQESRGIGGIYFDNLKPNTIIPETETKHTKEELEQFLINIGEAFIPIYQDMIQNNHSKAFTSEEKNWQLQRRGRFTEFNLMYDRATHLGMESFGRTDAAFADLPPQANWTYKVEPEEGSAEFETLTLLRNPQDWLS